MSKKTFYGAAAEQWEQNEAHLCFQAKRHKTLLLLYIIKQISAEHALSIRLTLHDNLTIRSITPLPPNNRKYICALNRTGLFFMALNHFYPSWCLPPPQRRGALAKVSSDSHSVALLLSCSTWGLGWWWQSWGGGGGVGCWGHKKTWRQTQGRSTQKKRINGRRHAWAPEAR